MYYYHFGDCHVVGASPEILVRQEHTPEGEQKITIRPLAGTRPRGADRSFVGQRALHRPGIGFARGRPVGLSALRRSSVIARRR